jgi:transcriptional regulator with XRE-family HTH domain
VTPNQLREARRLLGWTIEQVAAASGAYYHVIYNYEKSCGTTRRLFSSSRVNQLPKIRAALEAAGVEFTDEDAPGVRLRL